MKKIIFLSLVLISLSFVFAANGVQDGTGSMHDSVIAAGGQGGNVEPSETKPVVAQPGKYILNNEQVEIKKDGDRKRLMVGEVSANCDCNLTHQRIQNRTALQMALSNGRNAEIKVMPDVASQIALERLRLKVCSEANNCTLELKEVGIGENAIPVYDLQSRRGSKVFGIFNAEMDVGVKIDAETGDVISVKKPWWAFLASEPEEEIIE